MRYPKTVLLLTVIGLSGCQFGAKPPPNTVETKRAMAKVLAVVPERWEVSLQTPEGRRMAYWTENTVFIRGKQAMTDYTLPAGAQIEYKGIENRGEIWLRMVWVLKE